MKKILLILAIGFISIVNVKGQAIKQLNFGGAGTGIYAGLEIPLGAAFAIVPQVSTDYNFTVFILSAKGNYYFDELFGLPDEWDVYGGANVGWRISNNGGFHWGAQIGGRWFWNEKWGLNAEFGGGSGVTGGLGVTMKL